jgi:hypothetical protein
MIEENIKLEYNKILAKFLGYKYFEPNVLVDVGDWNFKNYEHNNVFSKTPILVTIHPADMEFGYPEEKYFAKVPNPDFGKTEGNKWRGDLHELSWASLNEYELDFDASDDWNKIIEIYSKLKQISSFSMWEDGFELYLNENKPELAFKALAEYIKENKL